MKNSSYENFRAHLESDLELNSLEDPDELQMNTLTEKQQFEGNKDNTGSINSDANNSNAEKIKGDGTPKTVCLLCGTSGKTNLPIEKCYYGANTANRPLPWKNKPTVQNRPQLHDEENNITKSVMAAAQASN